jgi:hypothetical protein
MRPQVAIIVSGIISGTVGAVVAGHFNKGAPDQLQAAPVAPAARAVIAPPGWDPRLMARLSGLEQQVDRLSAGQAKPVPAPGSEAPPPPVVARERERLADYQRELDFRDQALAEHAREALDQGWARAQEESVRASLAGLGESAAISAVECRSRTCTATLAFPSPTDALVTIQQKQGSLSVGGCHGFIAIPPPPTGEGRYELTIVYNGCRG